MTAVPDLVFLIVESELGKNSPTKWIQNYWLRSPTTHPLPAIMEYFRKEPNQIKQPHKVRSKLLAQESLSRHNGIL